MCKTLMTWLNAWMLSLAFVPPAAARDAELKRLQQVLQQEQARFDNFSKQSVLEFSREKTGSDMETESYPFVPDSSDSGVWNGVDIAYSKNEHENKVWSSNILFSLGLLDIEDAELVEQASAIWIFDVSAQVGVQVDLEPTDNDLGRVCRARITVDTHSM